MHEEAPILEATTRERVGSRYSRRHRDQGQLPAILYGHGETPVPFATDHKAAVSHIEQGEKVFRLKLDDGDLQVVLLKDLQFDYLGDTVVHADFARVDLDERVTTRVPIKLTGEAKGVKSGAILMHPNTEIEIECTLSNLPDEIRVDVTELDVGDSITASQVQLPKSTMVLLSDPDAVVATIAAAAQEETDESGEVDAAATPEVLTEKKKEEGEE